MLFPDCGVYGSVCETKSLNNSLAVLLGLLIVSQLDIGNAMGQQDPTSESSDTSRSYTDGVSTSPSVGVGFYGGGWNRGHASTAQEGMARGLADVIRARGQGSVDQARANTENERARRAYMENRNFAVQSFVENRAIRDAYRRREFDEKYEKLASYLESKRMEPLSNFEFYENTGDVNWPIGLMHPRHKKGREEIEALLRKRAQDGSLPAEQYIRLNKLVRDWVNHMGDLKEDFSIAEVREATRFLRRLEMTLKGDLQ